MNVTKRKPSPPIAAHLGIVDSIHFSIAARENKWKRCEGGHTCRLGGPYHIAKVADNMERPKEIAACGIW